MNTSLGYSKRTLDNTKVLLSGGGDKLLSDFVGSISWDAESKELKYTPIGGTEALLVTLSGDTLDYVSKSGDTMSGDLTLSKIIMYGGNSGTREFSIAKTNSGKNVDIAWNWNNKDGAGLALRSVDMESGAFVLWAKNSSTYKQLIGKADGTFTWDGNNVLTASNSAVSLSGSTLTVKINGTSQSLTNTWNAMTGATSSANGTVGYVNAVPPKDGYNTKFLRADGTWSIPAYPTKASWNYDDVYVKSVSISDNSLRINKNGVDEDLTIPFATSATTATNATKIKINTTNPTSGTTYYPIFVNTASGNRAVGANDGIIYYTLEGTTEAEGKSYLFIGNDVASGTAGNKKGLIRIYASTAYYGQFKVANITENKTYTFNSGGTVLTSGNYNSYALPLSGGTLTGNVIIDTGNSDDARFGATNTNSSGTAIYLLASTNRGVYHSTAGWLITTNGTNSWLSIGNVGIGTDSPSYKLHVNGTANATTIYENGTSLASKYFIRDAWWNVSDAHDANDLRSGIVFAYDASHHSNTATTGTLVAFSCQSNGNYALQLQGSYAGNGLYFRNRNGDGNEWLSWRTIIHSGNIGSQSVNSATKDGDGNTISSTYLKLVGGTMTGALTINPSNTSSFQDGIILNDKGTGASEALTIKWTSGSYTTGVKLSADLANKYLIFHNGTAWQTIYHSGNNPFVIRGEMTDAYINGTTYSTLDNGTYMHTYTGASETIIHFQRSNCSASGLDIRFKYPQDSSNPLQYRKCIDSNRFASTNWVTLIDSLNIGSQSVASATKASQDADGNTISSTYLKLAGGTMTGSITPNTDNAIDLGSSTKRWRYIYSYGIWGKSGAALRLGGNDATLMYLTSDAKCGIGTDSPSQKLHVSGGLLAITNNSRTVNIGAQNSSCVHIYNDNNSTTFFNGGVSSSGNGSYDLGGTSYYWNVGYFNRIIAKSTTDAAPNSANHVALITGDPAGQHIEFDGNEIMSKATGTTTGVLYLNAGGGNVSINETGGNCGIGNSTPSYKLHVSGNVAASNFYTTSDRNKKQNISLFSEHIRKFQLKDTEKWHYGVIAQEVPEMFRDGKEGNMTVNYTSILSYYVGLLENKVASLEKELSILKQKLK